MKHKSRHKKYLKKALREATKGVFTTGANPRVGCVLVKAGRVIAKAHHQRVGETHAEALALRLAGEQARGATAYVTLEPCSHQGRNPPCADALIKAGVKRVVVCNDDPNPLVAGQGYRKLSHAGIEVIKGLLQRRGDELNRGFFHRMHTGLPWVRCKLAQSIDGRTAMDSGESIWITGRPARRDVQYWRGRSGAIITGIETVLHDDCQLTVRADELPDRYRRFTHDFAERQPLRVIIDSELRLPLDARVLQHPASVMVVTAADNPAKSQRLTELGVAVEVLPDGHGSVDLQAVIRTLGQREINEVLVESGATLAGSLLRQQLLDELLIYTAPVIMGSTARPLFKIDIEEMADRLHIEPIQYKQMGKDWLIRALVKT